MKKTFVYLLCILLLILAGCGSSETASTAAPTSQPVQEITPGAMKLSQFETKYNSADLQQVLQDPAEFLENFYEFASSALADPDKADLSSYGEEEKTELESLKQTLHQYSRESGLFALSGENNSFQALFTDVEGTYSREESSISFYVDAGDSSSNLALANTMTLRLLDLYGEPSEISLDGQATLDQLMSVLQGDEVVDYQVKWANGVSSAAFIPYGQEDVDSWIIRCVGVGE